MAERAAPDLNDASVFRRTLIGALEKFEGRKNYFYRDSVGQVTIGVGHLVPTEADALALRLIHRNDGKPATQDEIRAAYRAVKAEAMSYIGPHDHKKHTYGAGHYKNVPGAANIAMPEPEIDRLRDRHVRSFGVYLNQRFCKAHGYKHDFADFPADVRLALYDMMFNWGPTKFPAKWPSLVRALKAEDWRAAAAASRRPQLSRERNAYVHNLFMQAATGQKASPAPGPLPRPNSAPSLPATLP